MKRNFLKNWLIPIGLGFGAALVLVGSILSFAVSVNKHEAKKIRTEVQELREELKARGEFIARLQKEVEYANTKADWVLKKIDKHRILIPVLNGDVYKIVEIEYESQPPEETEGR